MDTWPRIDKDFIMNSVTAHNLPVLAGADAGKTVKYTPNISDAIAQLIIAAETGNYYPLLAYKQLAALTSGMVGKANVYVPPENTSANHSFQHFDVYVPGIKARVERRSNDNYVVTSLELSGGWDEIRDQDRKPGIYSVTRNKGDFDLDYSDNQQILLKDKRNVIIADGQYKNTHAAAKNSYKHACKSSFGSDLKQDKQFDLVYSSIGKSLGGGKQYNAAQVNNGKGMAAILAHAMTQARDQEGVKWIAEGGGSAILTQAMQILANNKVPLKDANHAIYLYKPGTCRTEAVKLAQQLDINLEAGYGSMAYTSRGIMDDLRAKKLRMENMKDSYSGRDYAKTLATYGLGGAGIVGAVTFVGGLPSVAALFPVGVASAISNIGMVASGIGASGVGVTAGKHLIDDMKRRLKR